MTPLRKSNLKPFSGYQKTPTTADGWIVGNLPQGCQSCMQGQKLVYFMGGDCSRPPHCAWYCPINPARRNPEAYFADEIKIPNPHDESAVLSILVEETKKINGTGMSFTGGDPLSSPAKCAHVITIIKAMKATFGTDFHIHLYTNGITFNALLADQLDEAGLDEIRFHPQEADFGKIDLAIGHHYQVGAEVPVIPTEANHQYLLALADHPTLS